MTQSPHTSLRRALLLSLAPLHVGWPRMRSLAIACKADLVARPGSLTESWTKFGYIFAAL